MSNRTIAQIARELDVAAWRKINRRHRRRFVANVVFIVCVAGLIGIGLTLTVAGVANGAVW